MIGSQYYLPLIAFDTGELEALGLGISMVRQWSDPILAAKADRALGRIKAVSSAPLQSELDQITSYSMTNTANFPWSVSFSGLRDCIRARRWIDITYTDGAQNRTSRRVRPLALIFCGPL